MLQAGVPSRQIEGFARQDGIDFKVTPALERDLRKAGATESLILLLKKAEQWPRPRASHRPGRRRESCRVTESRRGGADEERLRRSGEGGEDRRG